MTFRIFVLLKPLSTLISHSISSPQQHFPPIFPLPAPQRQPTQPYPHLPSKRTCTFYPSHQAIWHPSLSTLFPENNKNPASFYLPYRPTLHLYPSSTQHSMSRLSTGNPVDYQACKAHHTLG